MYRFGCQRQPDDCRYGFLYTHSSDSALFLKYHNHVFTPCKWSTVRHNGLRNICLGFSWTCCFSSLFWSISSEFQSLQFWYDFILFFQPMSLKKLLMTLYLEIASKVQVLLFCFCFVFFLKFKLFILKQHSLWFLSRCLSNVASLGLHNNL